MIPALLCHGIISAAKEVWLLHCMYISLKPFSFLSLCSFQAELDVGLWPFYLRALPDLNLRSIGPTFGDLLDLRAL